MKLKKGIQLNGSTLLIFLGWLMYATSYLGKVNYSANITQIIDFYQISKAEAGIPPTLFFFAYGIGQVFNGVLCKKYNIKWMIFLSLAISGSINLAIAIGTKFEIIKYLWLINGFVLSILWPSLVRLMAESLPEKDLGRSSVVLGTTVATGTLIIYGLSSIFAIFNNFKLAFYVAAFSGITVAAIWMLFYNKAVNIAKLKKDAEDCVKESDLVVETNQSSNGLNKELLLISVCALCFCAVGINLIKDGLTTWVPSILKEEYATTDSLSILLTLFLPIVAMFGNFLALTMHKKIPDYIMHCFVVFIAIAGTVGVILWCLSAKNLVIMLAGLVIVSFLASSLNSLVTSIYPMFMREYINSGLIAGTINGFCYLGSTISSYGLGYVADKYNWTSVFWVLLAACGLICLICIGYYFIKAIIKKLKSV